MHPDLRKIWIVASTEFGSTVRTKSFLIGPLGSAAHHRRVDRCSRSLSSGESIPGRVPSRSSIEPACFIRFSSGPQRRITPRPSTPRERLSGPGSICRP